MNKAAKTSTCGRCRAKKIRCDGQNPCGPCSRARVEVDCNYTASSTSTSHGPDLRKGAACTACRRKKKKCSGNWPCQTCVISRKEDDCKFDDGSQLSFTRALIERTLELEQLLSRAKETSPSTSNYAVGPHLSAELDHLLSSNSLVPPEPIPLEKDPFIGSRGDVTTPSSLPEDPFSHLESVYESVPPQGLLSVVAPDPVPPPPPVGSPADKKFRLRKLFLSKRIQLGFTVPAHKLNALANGDLSGADVHPVLVHVCHLWGYMLDYYDRNNTWIYAPDSNGGEVAQMRLILGSLNGMLGPTPDPVTSLMTYISLSLYFFNKGDFSRGQEFLSVAGNAVLAHDLDLAAVAHVPTEGENKGIYSIDPFSDTDQLRAAFSHLIYIAVAAQVVLAAPPVIDTRLMDKFDLLMNTQVTSNVDINFLRAKSIRLFTQARKLTSKWNHGQNPPASWFEEYWKLVEQLHAHLGVLSPVTLRASFIPDAHTTELGLKLSSTMAFAALANLYGIFAPSSHIESSRRYRDAVVEIASISSSFSMEDCKHLDPILPLCWSVATKPILDNQVVCENQDSIIAAIRACNNNLQQVVPFVIDFANVDTMLAG
ncbi:hypothetical protein DFH07DRAFT_795679 [Mycena maculata]|uniref:Zn(2)-C6 fungal-type domain-containing protein n=1 Tax=Mycena maculata TaxID=230809 RepID=A0AAD7K7K0_9AGAR|nr:hypothetical protein DFH07DRAFT_795679 [Mycena maculata]